MNAQRDIVLLAFPFSDLQASKVRPAVIMSNDDYNRRSEDMVVIPLTSNIRLRDYTVLVTSAELESGNLIVDCKAKVDRVFSVSQKLVRMKIGRVSVRVHERLMNVLLGLLCAA
jgi:mRNA interferase MazF